MFRTEIICLECKTASCRTGVTLWKERCLSSVSSSSMYTCSDVKRNEIMCICCNLRFHWTCLLVFVRMSAAVISAGKMKQHYSLDGQNLSRFAA